ncbi:MAG: permease [bacterium]
MMPDYPFNTNEETLCEIPGKIPVVAPDQEITRENSSSYKNTCYRMHSIIKGTPKRFVQLCRNPEAAQVGFLVCALGLLFILYNKDLLITLAITFVSIVLEAFPFMLLGAMIGGFIEVFVPRERIASMLPEKRWITTFLAAGLGVIFPVCECAVVPVVRRLLRKGIPLGAAVAYLLGGPIVNPLVAASTTVAYSYAWQITVIRLLCGYFVAVSVGILMDLFFSRKQAVLPEVNQDHGHCEGHDHTILIHINGVPYTLCSRIALAIRHAADDFFDIGRFFVIGAFIAGVLQAFVARSTFASMSAIPVVSIILMMGLAIALNLCSEADAFVAASFRRTPVPLSAQMAFMVLGPMLDVKLLLMYVRVFHKRTIAALSGMTFVIVFISMIIIGMII